MRREKLLIGKRIFISGGSRGLGKAMCEIFANEGADIAFNYRKDREGADAVVENIEQLGQKALSFQLSVLDGSGIDNMVRDIEKQWGGIDVLVNNAGTSQPLPIALLEEKDWDDVTNINIKGPFMMTRAILRGMIRRKSGCILNIGSLAGVRLIAAPLHYSTSKAAMKGFSESLSKEVSRYNIRVNCLAPGLLDEGLSSNLPEHRERDYLQHVALHRKGTTQEVARFAAFLVSERNSYMNGCTIVIDGGF